MSKLTAFILLLVCLGLGFGIGYSAKTVAVLIEENKNNSPYQKYPRRTILVNIQVTQQETLFDALRNFAEEEGFAIRIAPTAPSGIDFIVQMWREDVKVTALNDPEPGNFRVGIFDTDSAVSIPEWAIDSLQRKLIRYIENIPNVTITEQN